MSSDQVMQWRLIIEEYRQDIKYIPGPENVVAEALSRLSMVDETIDAKQMYTRQLETTK